jgi:hypothetical protein
VLGSAALQLLQPAELQAAMAGALAPLAMEGKRVGFAEGLRVYIFGVQDGGGAGMQAGWRWRR